MTLRSRRPCVNWHLQRRGELQSCRIRLASSLSRGRIEGDGRVTWRMFVSPLRLSKSRTDGDRRRRLATAEVTAGMPLTGLRVALAPVQFSVPGSVSLQDLRFERSGWWVVRVRLSGAGWADAVTLNVWISGAGRNRRVR